MDLACKNGLAGIPELAALYGVSPRQILQLDAEFGWKAILAGGSIEVPSATGRSGNGRSIYSCPVGLFESSSFPVLLLLQRIGITVLAR